MKKGGIRYVEDPGRAAPGLLHEPGAADRDGDHPCHREEPGDKILDYIFAGLLAILAVRVFLKRKQQLEKPKWMPTIQEADSKRVFLLGLLLYSFMPTDIICMLTAGQYLVSHKMHFTSVIPFLALTFFIAALPVFSYLMFRKRAEAVMPRVQEWLDTHAWVVNEIVIIFIIFMMLFG